MLKMVRSIFDLLIQFWIDVVVRWRMLPVRLVACLVLVVACLVLVVAAVGVSWVAQVQPCPIVKFSRKDNNIYCILQHAPHCELHCLLVRHPVHLRDGGCTANAL